MQNVKAYLRRGTARESLRLYREALQGLSTTYQTVDGYALIFMARCQILIDDLILKFDIISLNCQ